MMRKLPFGGFGVGSATSEFVVKPMAQKAASKELARAIGKDVDKLIGKPELLGSSVGGYYGAGKITEGNE